MSDMEHFHMELLTNKVNIRWLKILYAFERRNELTTVELSNITEATTRTVISDISDIKDYFGEAIFIYSRNSGYRFSELMPEEYILKKRKILDKEPLFRIITYIFLGEKKSSSEWADKLYISDKSITKILKKLYKIVQEYEFELSFSPVDFVGKEQNIRKFFLDFFYEGDITPHTITPPIEIENIVKEFSSYYEQNKHVVIQFSKFCYLLLIMFKRKECQNEVTIPEEIKEKILRDSEYKFVKKLNEIILKRENFLLDEIELAYVMLIWITNRNIEDVKGELAYIDNYMDNKNLMDLIRNYCEVAEIDIDGKESIFIQAFFLSYYLKNILSPMYIRNLSDVTVYVKKYFFIELKKNITFFKGDESFPLIFKKQITVDLAVNLTLFMDSLNKTYQSKIKNVGFLLEGNQNVCQNIWATASRYVGNYHQLYFLDTETFTEKFIKEKRIDFIVTNYSEYVTNQVFKADYILIKSIPTPEDWKLIIYTIEPSTILGRILGVK